MSNGQDRPPWWIYLLLPLLHFASVKLTLLCAVTPETEVVVWLPNAVLLAALMRYQGQRGWAMAALTYSSDVLASLSAFSPWGAVLLSLVNLAEVVFAYWLMRRMHASLGLQRFRDFGKFIAAGPIAAALLASLLASAVLLQLDASTTTPYLTLVRLWWFGDALGLLIYTPLLLSFSGPVLSAPIRFTLLDGTVVLLGLALAGLVFSIHRGEIGGVSVTPDLLLPPVLYLAVRFGVRWTALAVALISLATAWVLTTGHQPFGAVDVHLEIVRAQEFIFTLCTIGIGFAILLTELKTHERGLEDKVRERTQALEATNTLLAALSATDGLTGIANRRRFDEVLASEWSRAARSGQPLALVMLDVDFFKAYNDHYGHLAGDDCLRHIARMLAAHLHRTGDLVARYGGEEFVLLAPVRDAAEALHIAETARQALATLALPHAASPFGMVTASLGVALHVPTVGETTDLLVQQADQALYQAKARGRNQTVLQASSAA
ncbi:diguanylate cyclase [Rhodoferax sp.]|uniref:GGDEF domain-containing protein n=1 Tax=Rhodoferax sp. TaxID=50421 RepID=UPI0025EF1FBF|nr:diguanylate cyclase [Rhodoferax sp.]